MKIFLSMLINSEYYIKISWRNSFLIMDIKSYNQYEMVDCLQLYERAYSLNKSKTSTFEKELNLLNYILNLIISH